MASNQASIIPLLCKSQNYDWGKLGESSFVYQLLVSQKDAQLDSKLPYAELWMGTHPNAPSQIQVGSDSPSQSLLEHITASPANLLGVKTVEKFGSDLPFLFKVLSIRKALSIQAHPDKSLAKHLHEEFPNVYKDNNHKPEMALALTPFEALCGFRLKEEILTNITNNPELLDVLSDKLVNDYKNGTDEAEDKKNLKILFNKLMTTDTDIITVKLNSLINRFKQIDSKGNDALVKLVLSVYSEYPNDVGVFSIFLLNYIVLEPNTAIFLKANEPHAYLSGDCIECMATSDNVVRAGLTPKFKDVKVLTEMLTYTSLAPANQIMKGDIQTPSLTLFNPPIEEFSVLAINLNEQQATVDAHAPGIIIVTDKKGKIVWEGGSLEISKGFKAFVPNGVKFTVEGELGLKAYFAYCKV